MTDPAEPAPPSAFRGVVTGLAFGLSGAIGLAAAVFSTANTFLEPRLAPRSVTAAANSQEVIRTEPFLRPDIVRRELGSLPPVVRQALEDYNRSALIDIQHNTQDLTRKNAPSTLCANAGGTQGDTRAQALALYGLTGCDEGGPLYTESIAAVRFLVYWNAQRHPATGLPWSLPPDRLKAAADAFTAAESTLVACRYKNPLETVLKLTPAVPGYEPVAVGALVLDPGAEIVVPLVASEQLGGAQVVDPTCAADYDLADQELRRPYPSWLVLGSIVTAVLALLLGMLSVAYGWAKFK